MPPRSIASPRTSPRAPSAVAARARRPRAMCDVQRVRVGASGAGRARARPISTRIVGRRPRLRAIQRRRHGSSGCGAAHGDAHQHGRRRRTRRYLDAERPSRRRAENRPKCAMQWISGHEIRDAARRRPRRAALWPGNDLCVCFARPERKNPAIGRGRSGRWVMRARTITSDFYDCKKDECKRSNSAAHRTQ